MTVTPQPFTGSQLDRWEVYAAVVLLAGGGAMTVQRCRLETGYGGAVSCLPLPLLPLSFATQNLRFGHQIGRPGYTVVYREFGFFLCGSA